MKSRAEIAREESTRDPIFLLQSGRVVIYRELPGYSFDGDYWWKDEDDGDPDISDQIDDAWLQEHDYAFMVWDTETVFFTREEATAWAEARSYRWKHWQVYCVPAEGELANLLKIRVELRQEFRL